MHSKRYKTETQQAELVRSEHSQQGQNTDGKVVDIFYKIVQMASQQKLLPNLLQQMQAKCYHGRKERFLQYQKLVKNIYRQQGKVPLKYNPEEALTFREKFMKKVAQLQNHELQIQYFEKIRTRDGKIMPLFKGMPLERVHYQTKNEFIIFRDFNENKFRKSYSQIFDDKLQLKQSSLVRKQRIKTTAKAHQKQQGRKQTTPNPKFDISNLEQGKAKERQLKKFKKVKLRPLTQGIQLESMMATPTKKVSQKYKPHMQKLVIGKMISDIESECLYGKMLRIGSYSLSSVSQANISLTKESFSKYLKSFYQRQVRIVDFLQIKPSAFKLCQYINLCTKLKLMPLEHIMFMTFLVYDFNNDGYICDNDMRRINWLVQGKHNDLIKEDLKVIQGIREKKLLNRKSATKTVNESRQSDGQMDNLKYLQLYKLSQITEHTYFSWLNRENKSSCAQNKQAEQNQETEKETPQMKNSLNNPFNPAVFKFKRNYLQQNGEIRKYLLGIKGKKTYITFGQFKCAYLSHQQQNYRKVSSSQGKSSQVIESNKLTKNQTKNASTISSSRQNHNHSYSQNKSAVCINKKQTKKMHKHNFSKPFLWYDLMDKLTGVRYEGLKYE